MGDLTWKLVPVEPTDEMLRSACAVDFPALYRTHLRHPDNGPFGAAETEQKIAKERRRWAAMLAASPPSPTLPSREGHFVDANKMVVPNWEDAARVIYDAMGFAYEGRSVDLDGNPYGSWKTACDAAQAILALFTDDTKQAGSYNRGGEDCTEVKPLAKPMPLDTVEVVGRKG